LLHRIGSCPQRDAPELLVVQFQGVARLLDLPIGHSWALRRFSQECLDFGPAQVPAPAARMPCEEPAVFSWAPASRSTAMHPPGHRGCGFSGATPRRVV